MLYPSSANSPLQEQTCCRKNNLGEFPLLQFGWFVGISHALLVVDQWFCCHKCYCRCGSSASTEQWLCYSKLFDLWFTHFTPTIILFTCYVKENNITQLIIFPVNLFNKQICVVQLLKLKICIQAFKKTLCQKSYSAAAILGQCNKLSTQNQLT